MKLIVSALIFFGIAVANAETPQEVARRIISSQVSPAYNPLNETESELNRAAEINSELRLRALMLGDTVSEELRVCYALHLIHNRIGILSGFSRLSGTGAASAAAQQNIERDRDILAAYLRRLNKSKE
jgi:hypothetical protein